MPSYFNSEQIFLKACLVCSSSFCLTDTARVNYDHSNSYTNQSAVCCSPCVRHANGSVHGMHA